MNDFAGLYTAYRTGLQLKSAALLSNLAARTRSIGAICESSPWLARKMQQSIRRTDLPVVELGAGYGSLTQLLPDTTVSIEREQKRFDHLKQEFPDRAILDCCAISYIPDIDEASVVLSSIPSVNNPEFSKLRAAVIQGATRGTVKEVVTYTYFPHSPFADIFPIEEVTALELRNLPPAFVWSYRC